MVLCLVGLAYIEFALLSNRQEVLRVVVAIVCMVGKYFGLDDDGYERQITDECLRNSSHQLPEHGTYQSQTMYTPYTVKMGQLTLYRSVSLYRPAGDGNRPEPGASPGQKMWGGLGHAWRARGARAYNGVSGHTPIGVQGQTPGQVVRGAKPLKLKIF